MHWIASYGAEMLLEAHPDQGYVIAHRPPSRGFLNHVRVDRRRNVVWFSQPGNNQIVNTRPPGDSASIRCRSRSPVPAVSMSTVTATSGCRRCMRARSPTERLGWYLAGMAASVPRCPPAFCRVDQEGNLWVSETGVDRIVRFDGSRFREFVVPTEGSITSTSVTDTQGRIWFTEGGFRGGAGGNKIGVLDPCTGEVVELPLPTANAQPVALLRDADGTISFGESGTGRIGRALSRSERRQTLRQ